MKTICLLIAGAVLALGACSSKKNNVIPAAELSPAHTIVPAPAPSPVSGRVNAMPKAVVYQMSGDYERNVPVQLNPNGSIASYPAPSDVRNQQPVRLARGWWLDRRGISRNSVFTKYTYDEYQNLSAAPTPAQLREAIIPGAYITRFQVLDMTPQQAAADTAAVNKLIKEIIN